MPASLARLVLAALPLPVLLLAWVPAPGPVKISGSFTASYSQQNAAPVADAQGHALVLNQSRGTNRNTGNYQYMDGAEVTLSEIGDLTQGTGVHQGYIIFAQGADSTVNKWSGKVTTVLAADHTPVTSFVGTWTKARGTGKYAGITGSGTYKGRMLSQTEYQVAWEGSVVLGADTATR